MSAVAIAEVPRGTTETDARIHSLPVDFITVGPNVRVNVTGIDELAASIAEQGVLQPIKVRHAEDGAGYVVVWGQRRLLASRIAGLTEIPALIDDAAKTEAELALEQLAENLSREDLNPIDRARAMKAVVDAGVSQADLARKLGIGASTVSNDVGLLEAPAKIRGLVEDGKITPAHAKALKGLPNSAQVDLAGDVVEYGWSAHETERRAQNFKANLERRAQEEAASETARAQRRAQGAERIAELAKTLPADTPIRIRTSYYGRNDDWVAKAIAEAGFVDVADQKGFLSERPKKGDHCACSAYMAEIGWQGNLVLKPACIVQAHSEAQYKAERAADTAEREYRDRITGHLQGLLTTEFLELIRRSPVLARALLWNLFDWSLNDWVRDHKGDRKKPNAWDEISSLPDGELAVEMARFFAKGFGDRYNVKLDWPRIAREIGLEDTPA